MPDDLTTSLRAAQYDALRESLGIAGNLKLYDDDGGDIATVTSGWFPAQSSGEETGERGLSLRVVSQTDYSQAVFFGFEGRRYERQNHANPPIGNAGEWIWTLKPVGLDS